MVTKTRKIMVILLIAALLFTNIPMLPANAQEAGPPTITLPQEGLEAWYKLDNAQGSLSAADSSGNEHHSFNASGTWQPTNGVVGGAIALNGTSEMIQLNTTGDTFLKGEFSTHSASMWFKANDTASRQVLYERGGNTAGLAIQINENKLEAAVVNASVRGVISIDFTDITAWHHILVSFDKGVFKLYLDGQLVKQVTVGYVKVAAALNEAAIGARAFVDAFGGSKGGAWFNGMIDDVRLYNTAVVPKAEEVDVTGVSVNESNVTLAIGDTHTLTATVEPVFATNKNRTWTSSNPDVATVKPDGLFDAVVEAKSEGTATITVTTEDGKFTATTEITVEKVAVETVSLNKTDIVLPVNTAYTLSPSIEPANATNQNVTWSSNNEGVATIDESGTIRAVAPGTAVITVVTEDGSFTATSKVRVDKLDGDGEAYLMSYFRSDIAQTGQKDLDLHYSYSRDGVRWYELNDNLPVFNFADDLRDPFIAKGKDGVWRLLFTSPTLNPDGSSMASSEIGYAESRDLINWTNYKRLDVMKSFKDKGTFVYNSWAPEWSYDPVKEEYVLYWSSTLVNNAPNDNKHYYTTTKDWETFTDAQLLFDPGQKTIDANLYQIDANVEIDGRRVRDKLGVPLEQEIPGNNVWFMFYKDETPAEQGGMRNRQTWSIDGVTGSESYENPAHISNTITPSKNEGATVFKVGDKWHMTYDYWWAGKFGLKTSTDLTNPASWSDEVMDLRIPYRARHSGMTTIGNNEIWNLINNYSLEAFYPFIGNADDSSGHQYDGEVIGNPSFVSLEDENTGYAKFNGVSDAIGLNHLKDSFYTRSISMWVKSNETERTQMLYHEGNKANGGLALKIEGNQLIAGVSKDDVSKTVSTAFEDTYWHHVVSIYEEGMIKLYVDGVLKGELNTGFQPKQSSLNQDGSEPKKRDPELYDVETTSNTARLGAGSQTDVFGTGSADAYYNGLMGEVRLYTIPLFDLDIDNLYQASKEKITNIDIVAPVTTASTDTAPNSNGWFNEDVTVTFAATDDYSGVSNTFYTVDGAEAQAGTSVIVSGEGYHVVTYWSVDKAGNVEAAQTVTINMDITVPELNVALDTPVLWSPNHKLVEIIASIQADGGLSEIESVVLTAITSNELDYAPNSVIDDVANDIQEAAFGENDTNFLLRAERSGEGTGRVYTVTYTVTDKAGNQTTATAVVEVPHDKGINKEVAKGKK